MHTHHGTPGEPRALPFAPGVYSVIASPHAPADWGVDVLSSHTFLNRLNQGHPISACRARLVSISSFAVLMLKSIVSLIFSICQPTNELYAILYLGI